MFDSDDPDLSRVKTLEQRATRLPHYGGKGTGHKGASAKTWLLPDETQIPPRRSELHICYIDRRRLSLK